MPDNSFPVSRRFVLKATSVSAIALGSGGLHYAQAAEGNSLYVGGRDSTTANARATMPVISGDFQASFDYYYPAGPMWEFAIFALAGDTGPGPQLTQTDDGLTLTTATGTSQLEFRLSPDQWHRFVVECAAGALTIFVDGQRIRVGEASSFPVPAHASYTTYGPIGALSDSNYHGTAYFDTIDVRASSGVQFEQHFDAAELTGWEITTAANGLVQLANPAFGAEVPVLSGAQIEVGPLVLGGAVELRVAGHTATGRGVWLEPAAVTLTTDSNFLTAVSTGNGYFTVTGKQVGTTTVTATISQAGFNNTVSQEVVVKQATALGTVALSSPLGTIYVADTHRIKRTAQDLGGLSLDPDSVDWTWSVDNSSVATVDADGTLTAIAPGSVTVTATATSGADTETATVSITVAELTTAKNRSSYYTTARRAAAVRNIENSEWAAAIRQSAVEAADAVLARGYQNLWAMMPSQDVPRSYAMTSIEARGCLNCGTKVIGYGQYPYSADVWAAPWKLTCPSCTFIFPTNDFAAYYAGGLDEYGFFDPQKAQRHNDSLIAAGGRGNLVNIGYPDKGETWGVDAGPGYRLEAGQRYTPIAYYTHWKIWYTGEISKAITALRDAYVYSGKREYADAGIVLLDRMADLYPHFNLDQWTYPDGYLNSNGNTSRGKVVGSIWETGFIRDWLLAYDAFFPALADDATEPVSQSALDFLHSKSALMDKTNRKRIRRNIEDGLLRQILPAMKRAEVRGNQGMHQATLALAAVVMDSLPETKEWLEFTWATGAMTATSVAGGNVGSLLVDLVDRDGNGNESAPGYNVLWLGNLMAMADYLDQYSLPGLQNYDLYANAKFVKLFEGTFPLTMVGIYTPTIGDTGSAGNPSMLVQSGQLATGFLKTQRPLLAQVLHALNGYRSGGLRGGIFDDTPEALTDLVQAVVDEHGEWRPTSDMMTGYGFAALREGARPATQQANFQVGFADLTVVEATRPRIYYPSNGTLQFEATEVGDTVTFSFELPTAMRDTLSLSVWTANTYGIYEVKVDGQIANPQVNFAGAGLSSRTIGEVDLSAGAHTITFTLVDATMGKKCGLRTLIIGHAQAGETDHGTQRGSWLYFGRNTGHGHLDQLNVNYYAWGMDLLPDMGYPRYANSIDMHRKSLVKNTLTHNTVVVNDTGQTPRVVVGNPQLFDAGPRVQSVEVDSPSSYPNLTRYRRALTQIEIDEENSYLVDVFRTQGGTNHMYSLHSMDASAVVAEGVTLVPQQSGGAYVGTLKNASTPYLDTVDDPSGLTYFFDVDRSSGPVGDFAITWQKIKDTWNVSGVGINVATEVNLRWTLLGAHSEVALASCEPPLNRPGNPKRLRYGFARAAMKNGGSVFTAVIEPYRGQRLISAIEAVPVTTPSGAATEAQQVRAVKVTLASGRVDLIVHALDGTVPYLVEGKIFKTRLGVVSTHGDQVSSWVIDGGTAGQIFGELDALTGTVANFTKELASENQITVTLNPERARQVTPESLVGRYLYANNDGQRNGVFQIESVSSWSTTQAVLSIGTVTPIRAYVDPYDFSKGFVYDLAAGKPFRIPLRHDNPTQAHARLISLLGMITTTRTTQAEVAVLVSLVNRAADHEQAHRLAAAIELVRQFVAKLDKAKVAISADLKGWLRDTATGWLAQLSK